MGTPPFVCGLWFLAPADADSESIEGLCSIVRDAYNDHLAYVTSSQLDDGTVRGQYADDTSAYDVSVGTLSPNNVNGPRNGGWAARIILQGSRPPGGRANSMYAPMPAENLYNEAGTFTGGSPTYATTVGTWAEQLLDDVEPTVFQWRNRHFLGTEDASSSSVTGASLAPTASFLRLRYR